MRLTIRSALTLAALVVAAGCDRTSDTPPAETSGAPADPAGAANLAVPPQARAGLAIEGEGLRIFDSAGAARALPFGTPQATVIAAVTAATGGIAPELSTNEECGQGPTQFAQYPDGVQLLFKEEVFNGWFLREPGLTTVDGIGVGTARSALDAARTVELVPDSSLGVEFSAGDLFGFLTSTAADATVESLWAGGNCFFR